jgi:nucleoside-diphosphate-sugar epimerase
MEILILGGTGAMGNYLAKLLSDKGHNVSVTSRSERKSKDNIEYVRGNAQKEIFLKTILKKHWDVIIDFMSYTTSAFQKRVDLLLSATSQYIFLSSARVYANSSEPVKETSPRLLDVSDDEIFLSTDEYSLAKAKQENMLRNSDNDNWTIIRPYITYSSQRLQLGVFEKEDWLYRALQGKTIVFSKDINARLTTMTFGLDVAKGIEILAGNKEALGETFHITSERTITWHEVLNTYLNILERHLGKRPKVMFESLENFLEIHPATYQVRYDRLFDRTFDNSKISKHININDFTETSDGLAACLEEFLKHPKFKQIHWRSEALKDRRTREFTKLNEIQGVKQKITYLLFRLIIKKLHICQSIILMKRMLR